MDNKYLDKLEFSKVLEMLENYAVTYLGKEIVKNLKPSFNKNEVQINLKETEQADILTHRIGGIPLGEIDNINVHLRTLEASGTLSIKQLLDLAKILKMSRELKEYYEKASKIENIDTSKLRNYFFDIYTNMVIEDKMFKSIIDENTIDDHASKNLYIIRKRIKQIQNEIKNKLNNYLHSKYLQEAFITIRNGRYVIPVKQEYRNEIKGFVHDISASGATIFVEPLPVFEMNNRINTLKLEEANEIQKIQQELSELFMGITKELDTNIKIIGKLDFIFAKAKFGIANYGVAPIINDKKIIKLNKARHPLIDKDKVVPVDIEIGEKYNTLVITGPNTGGKTVTLKTIGLLSCMGMSGLYIPAGEKSSIYVFDNIFADIGDEQSIADSLSTFSSHMINIVDMMKKSTEKSLILLDELCSGTDPAEGANLAISILEELNAKQSINVVTTHYSEIKNYAITTNNFENASSEFDVENMKPTYKILMGVPGRSNAFAISKRLGLEEHILNRAKELTKQENINIEDVLKEIYDNKILIENEKEKIQKNSKEIEELKKSLEKDNTELELQAKKIIDDAKYEARKILLNAKDQAEDMIRKVSEQEDKNKMNKIKNKLNEEIKELKIENCTLKSDTKPEDIKIGMKVYIGSINQEGTILKLPNKSNKVRVQIGMAKTDFHIEDIFIKNNNSDNTSQVQSEKMNKKEINVKNNVATEINVIGLTVDEAIPIIDKYLDECSMTSMKTTRIVHGKGTGKLRSGIQAYIKTHPHVKSFRNGTFGEGEMGVTIVELK